MWNLNRQQNKITKKHAFSFQLLCHNPIHEPLVSTKNSFELVETAFKRDIQQFSVKSDRTGILIIPLHGDSMREYYCVG
jgi:hypothetical protein